MTFDLRSAAKQWETTYASMERRFTIGGYALLAVGALMFASTILLLGYYSPLDWGCSDYGCPKPYSLVSMLGIVILFTGGALTYVQTSLYGHEPAVSVRVDDAGITFRADSGRERTFAWREGEYLGFRIHDASVLKERMKGTRQETPYAYLARVGGFRETPLPDDIYQSILESIEVHGYRTRKSMTYGVGEFDITFRRSP